MPTDPREAQKEGIITGLVRELTDQLADREVCVCAAIRMPDGYIVRGHRHRDCLRSAGEMARGKGVKRGDVVQGFLTTRERFVNRTEGLALQIAAGRPSADPTGEYHHAQLYSEDLY